MVFPDVNPFGALHSASKRKKERERELQHSSTVDFQQDQSNNNQQTRTTANSARTALFEVSAPHLLLKTQVQADFISTGTRPAQVHLDEFLHDANLSPNRECSHGPCFLPFWASQSCVCRELTERVIIVVEREREGEMKHSKSLCCSTQGEVVFGLWVLCCVLVDPGDLCPSFVLCGRCCIHVRSFLPRDGRRCFPDAKE